MADETKSLRDELNDWITGATTREDVADPSPIPDDGTTML
jgi:hypothetical protein